MQAKSADKVRSGEQVPGAEHISKKRKKSQDGADTTKRVAVEEASSGVKKSKKDKSERKAKKEKRRKRHGEESQPTLEPETEAMTIDDVRTGTTLGKEDEDAEIVRERRTKASPSPTVSSPTPRSPSSPEQHQQEEDKDPDEDPDESFTSLYLRHTTQQFADDIDALRQAPDFKGQESLDILVDALKQGAEIFPEEWRERAMRERREKIVGRRKEG